MPGCSGRRDVGQQNVSILQHLQSDRLSGASTYTLFVDLLIQFYLNNVTNLYELISHSTTLCHNHQHNHNTPPVLGGAS